MRPKLFAWPAPEGESGNRPLAQTLQQRRPRPNMIPVWRNSVSGLAVGPNWAKRKVNVQKSICDDGDRWLMVVLRDATINAKQTQNHVATKMGRQQSLVAREGGEHRLGMVEFVDLRRPIGVEWSGLLGAINSSKDLPGNQSGPHRKAGRWFRPVADLWMRFASAQNPSLGSDAAVG